MAWENVIIGYKITRFLRDEIIPLDAIFIRTFEHQTGVAGPTYNLHPVYETIYEYHIPVYKKKNIKNLTPLPNH